MTQKTLLKKATPEELVLEFFRRVWGPAHDLDAIDGLMTKDYVITTGGTPIRGRDQFKEWVRTFQERLHNAITTNEEMFVNTERNRVVSRFVCSGHNNGIFGLPPDHKPISFTGIAIWRVEDGKLAECWVERSAYELFQKLNS